MPALLLSSFNIARDKRSLGDGKGGFGSGFRTCDGTLSMQASFEGLETESWTLTADTFSRRVSPRHGQGLASCANPSAVIVPSQEAWGGVWHPRFLAFRVPKPGSILRFIYKSDSAAGSERSRRDVESPPACRVQHVPTRNL